MWPGKRWDLALPVVPAAVIGRGVAVDGAVAGRVETPVGDVTTSEVKDRAHQGGVLPAAAPGSHDQLLGWRRLRRRQSDGVLEDVMVAAADGGLGRVQVDPNQIIAGDAAALRNRPGGQLRRRVAVFPLFNGTYSLMAFMAPSSLIFRSISSSRTASPLPEAVIMVSP